MAREKEGASQQRHWRGLEDEAQGVLLVSSGRERDCSVRCVAGPR